MSNSYGIFWPNNHCRWLKRCGDEGQPLSVVFGGIHRSRPSLRRAGVAPGDHVFPLMVRNCRLFVIARLTAAEFISLRSYAEQLGLPADQAPDNEFELKEEIRRRWPELGHRLPQGCGTEVLLAAAGSPIRFDLMVAPERLAELTFASKKSASRLKYVIDGRLTRALSLHGFVRKLTPATADYFHALVDGSAFPAFRSGWRRDGAVSTG